MHSNSRPHFLRRPLLIAAAASLTLALAACDFGGGGSDGPSQPTDNTPVSLSERITQLEASGQLPRLDRSTDLLGSDANANGVRDDIDTWIAGRALSAQRTKALTRAAKTAQAALTVNPADSSAVRAVARQGARDINCISTVFAGDTASNNGFELHKAIEKYTFNTKPRVLAYITFNKALSGAVLSLPSGDTCDE